MSKLTDKLRAELANRLSPPTVTRAISSGMVSRLDDTNPFSGFSVISRKETGVGAFANLTLKQLANLPANKVRELVADANPDLSNALINFQNYCNAGWTLEPEGHPAFDLVFDTMAHTDSGFDHFLDALFRDIFLHGACFYEAVYDDDDRLRRLVALDPSTAGFIKSHNNLGEFYELVQYQNFGYDRFARYDDDRYRGDGSYLSLHDDPTIEYLPFWSSGTNPYGKSFVDSALFHMIMTVEFFKSYRDVLQSVIFPALVATINRETVKEIEADPNKAKIFVSELMVKLKEELVKMGPGSAVAYGDEVDMKLLSGLNSANMGGAVDFTEILEKYVTRGIQSNELLAGTGQSTTETKSRHQMANYSRLIVKPQNGVSRSLTRQFNHGLTRMGSSETAMFMFLRSIFEQMYLNAEIYQRTQEAFKSYDESMMSLMMWLDEAVEKGRMTKMDADMMWKEELEARKLHSLRSSLN